MRGFLEATERSKSKKRATSGLDGIPVRFLKDGATVIAPTV